jgi:hypothetical protein
MRMLAILFCAALLRCAGDPGHEGAAEARQKMAADSATRGEAAEFCIDKSEATLAGLGTFSPPEAVQSLGLPSSVEAGTGEDDGGTYATSILIFPHLAVHIDDRGYGIERIETRDSSLPLPSGVRVGMSLEEAQDRLRVPRGRRSLSTWMTERGWVGALCEATTRFIPSEYAQVRLYVTDADVIERIALTNYGP